MTYLIGIALGVATSIALASANADPGDRRRVAILLFWVGGAAAIGAKLYSGIERGGFVWHNPTWEIAAGYRYPGAMIAGLIALPLLHRIVRPAVPLARILDACVLGVCAGMVVIRAGCFNAGCCHGTITDLPWATRYGVDTSPWHAHLGQGLIARSAEWSAYGHPLQLYFLVAIVAIGAFLLWFRKYHQRYDGQLTLIFMVLNGLSKGALESLRFSYVPSLQIYSFVMATIGVLGLVYMVRRRGGATPSAPGH